MERWNRLAMSQEDQPRHRSKKDAQSFERAQRASARGARHAQHGCGSVASGGGKRSTAKPRGANASKASQVVHARLLRLLARWDRVHHKTLSAEAAQKKAAAKEAEWQSQKEAQATRQACRKQAAEEARLERAARAAARLEREQQKQHWRWLSRKDITMEELLHRRICTRTGCNAQAERDTMHGFVRPQRA
ncbi:unnamed protein product [Effrenium voratum]|nr:unnamed protein product [Effrenium voratum]